VEGSRQRVQAVLDGKTPERPPLYDLIRNDAVISHFAGETLTLENAAEVVPRALSSMLDATRPRVRLPAREREEIGPDGRKVLHKRWTSWREHRAYPSSEAYAEAHHRNPDESEGWTEDDEKALHDRIAQMQSNETALGETFFFWGSGATPGLVGLYSEVGLEQFSYYLADCPETIVGRLERNTVKGIRMIERRPHDACPPAVFLGDDMAFKGGTICSPAWMRREYFPRLKRIIAAWHKRGTKVLFHSDGNLMPVLDDLVEAGADGLNPIEVTAGMDIAEIHRRHPHLFMAGGIDVSQLLPFGTPQEIRDATVRALDDAGGRLMPGSTTELHDVVPLENFLAMHQAVLDYRY